MFALEQFQIGSKISSTGTTTLVSKDTNSAEVPVGVLAGGIVGGVVGVFALLLLWYLLFKRRRTSKSRDSIEDMVVRDGVLHSPTAEADIPSGPMAEPATSAPITFGKRGTVNLTAEPTTASLEPPATQAQNPFASSLDDLVSSDQPQQQQLISAMETLQRYLRLEPEASSSSYSNSRRDLAENLPPYDSRTREGPRLGKIDQRARPNEDLHLPGQRDS